MKKKDINVEGKGNVLEIMKKQNSSFTSERQNFYQFSSVAQLCQTLCDPMDYNLPGSSIHGILQVRIIEWVAHSLLQGIFPTHGLNLGLLHCSEGRFLTV